MITQSKAFPFPGCEDAAEFQKLLQKVGLPRKLRDRAVVALKGVSSPGEVSRRSTAVQQGSFPKFLDVLSTDKFAREGSLVLGESVIASSLRAAEALDDRFETMRNAGQINRDENARKGQFLISVLDGADVLEMPEVWDFVLGEEVLSFASHYFGEVPVLSGVSLKWSPPNDNCEESQLYHYDGEDRTQLKVFLNVKDVTLSSGPFTFVPADLSNQLPKTRRHSARLDDNLVESTIGASAIQRLTGPKGMVAAVDTSRCIHYGSRGNTQDRVMLFVQFNRFMAPKAQTTRWRVQEEMLDRNPELSQLRRMVLNVKK